MNKQPRPLAMSSVVAGGDGDWEMQKSFFPFLRGSSKKQHLGWACSSVWRMLAQHL